MVDNLQFTHTHNDVRLLNFPDESGQNESVAFPECRQQDSSREYLHQQLMRIVRSSASTLTTERKQNNLLLAYHLQLQDLSIREVSKKANNIKKEQLYGKHMKDWMDKEINGPIKEYEKLDRQRRLRRELARTQKQAKKTRLPKIGRAHV